MVFGFFTGLLGAFVLPALPAPAVGFLTAGFLVAPVGFVVDFVGGFAAGLLAGLAADLLAGLAAVTALVFFAVIVEDFTVGLATFLLTTVGFAVIVFAFTAVVSGAFLAGVFATVFVFTGALLAVLAARSPIALPAVVF